MSRRYVETTSSEPQNSYGTANNTTEASNFECNICLELAQEPIVTLCGHLFCWPCLYQWLHVHAHSQECPVCKALVEEDKLIPLYGRGKNPTDPRARTNIPHRPTGQRPAPGPNRAPPPPEHNHFGGPHANPWFMGPPGNTRFGNYTFSAAIGGLFPLLNFQVHGFPYAGAYGAPAGFPYGYPHSFHGGHAHGYPRQVRPRGQQADVYLKLLLIIVGTLVVASLVWF